MLSEIEIMKYLRSNSVRGIPLKFRTTVISSSQHTVIFIVTGAFEKEIDLIGKILPHARKAGMEEGITTLCEGCKRFQQYKERKRIQEDYVEKLKAWFELLEGRQIGKTCYIMDFPNKSNDMDSVPVDVYGK